jgi:hypothetical protein
MKRSKMSLSNQKKFTCNMGELIPCGLEEVLPGDTFQQNTTALIRLSPMLAPVMHTVHVRLHHWFVPHRIVMDDWEPFITGGDDGFDATVFPTIVSPPSVGFLEGSLADYLGLPIDIPDMAVSALPFRGAALIFNEWYRDQDLVDKLVISNASGIDTTTDVTLQNIAWENDYFTKARPWTQKGPEVSLPLAGNAPVVADTATTNEYLTLEDNLGVDRRLRNHGLSSGTEITMSAAGDGTALTVDLSDITAATVGDIRLVMALQRYEEQRARYGSRYVEYLRSLGVRSSDGRLPRPEYLGGGKSTLQFSEVLQTAEGTDPVGEIRGHGIAAMRSNRYRRYFEEHGYQFTFISIRPKTVYTQGLPRTWNRRTKEEFFQRELQHIGQQEILNKEIYAGDPAPDGVWGYTDRYREYTEQISTVAGQFRGNQDFWHMAREFASAPVLNGSFVTANPTKRIFAVTDPAIDAVQVMANHSIQARRMVKPNAQSFIY